MATRTKSAYQKALEKKKTGKSGTGSGTVKNVNGAAGNTGKSPYEQAYAKARSLRQLNGQQHVDIRGNAKTAATDYTKNRYSQQVNQAANQAANKVANQYGNGIGNTQGFKNYMQQLANQQKEATGNKATVPTFGSVDTFRTSPKQDNYTSLYTKLGITQPKQASTTNTTGTGARTGKEIKQATTQKAQQLQQGRKSGKYDSDSNLGTNNEEGMSNAFINNRIKSTEKEINQMETVGDYADYKRQQEYENAQKTKAQIESRMAEIRRDAQNGGNTQKRQGEIAELQAQLENENTIISRYEQQYGTKSGAQIGQEVAAQRNAAGLNNVQGGAAYMGNGFNTYMQQLNALQTGSRSNNGTGSTARPSFMKSAEEMSTQRFKTTLQNDGATRYSNSRAEYDNATETKKRAEESLAEVEGRLQEAEASGNTQQAAQLRRQKAELEKSIENENTIISRTQGNATAELTLQDKRDTLANFQQVQANRQTVATFEDEAKAAADFENLSDGSGVTQSEGHTDYYTIEHELVNLGTSYNTKQAGRDASVVETLQQAGVDLMTEEEKAVYNYYFNSGNKEKADEYLTALSPTLRARRTEANNAESYEYAQEHPLLATAESAATNVVNGAIFTPFQMMGAAMGSTDTDNTFYDYQNRTNYLRSGAGQRINDEVANVLGNEKAGEVAQWLYNTGNSAIDSFVSAAIGSVMMGAPVMGSAAMTAAQKLGTQAISLGLMSSQAASQTLKEKLDSGMDSGKAILYSAVYGGIESLTEIYSLETLMGDPTKFGLYLLKNFAAEGSEEIAGDFLRPAVDWVIARATDDKTELEKTYEGYLKQGMTAQEATMHTLGDWGVDTILDGLAGGISGVGSSIVYGGIGKVQDMAGAYAAGGTVLENDTVQNVLNVAGTLNQSGEAYKLAQEMQEGKKKRNAYNVGKLLQLTMQETGGAANVLQEQFTEDITRRLQEKGETDNVEEVAEAAATLMSTGTLTEEQAAVLSQSKHGMEVLNEASQDQSAEAVQRREESRKNQQTQQKVAEALQARETNNDTSSNDTNSNNTNSNETNNNGTNSNTDEQTEERDTETEARQTLTEAQATDTTGEAVKVQELTSTNKTGTATIKVEKGGTVQEVKLQDVTFDSERQETAYRMAAQMETPTKGQAFLQMLRKTSMPLDTARAAFNVIYEAGVRGTTLESSGITDEYRQMVGAEATLAAYEAGAQAQAKQNARLDFSEDVAQDLRDTIAALPDAAQEDYTGVIYKATKESKLSTHMAAQVALLNEVAKRYGLQVEVVDQAGEGETKGRINGQYFQGTNRIQVALDSDANLLTKTLAHEMTHFIREWNEDGYTQLAAFISSKLAISDGYSLQERIEEKQAQYKQIGQELTEEGALEEIVADSMFKVFENESYVADLFEQHQTLGEKIKSKLKNFAQELKNAAKRLKNAEAKAMAQQEAENMDELAKTFDEAAMVAMSMRMVKEAEKEAAKGTSYSLKEDGTLASLQDVNTINDTMRQEIENNQEFRDMLRQLRKAMQPGGIQEEQRKFVRNMAGEIIKKWSPEGMSRKTLTENLMTAFEAMANAKTTAESEIAMEAMADIAQDVIEKSGHYENTNAKEHNAEALLEDFKRGRVALSEQDWKEAKAKFGSAKAFRQAYAGIWNPPGQTRNVKQERGRFFTSCDDVNTSMITETLENGGCGFRVAGEEQGSPFELTLRFLDAMKPQWVPATEKDKAEYGIVYDVGALAGSLAMDIYDEYMKLPTVASMRSDVIDAMQGQMDTIKRENEELRKELQKAKKQISGRKRGLDAAPADVQAKIRGTSTKEAQEKTKTRKAIIRDAKRIAKKLNTPSTSFVPYTMTAAVTDLLKMVDFVNLESGATSENVIGADVIQAAKDAYMALNNPEESGTKDEALERTRDFFNAELVEDFDTLLNEAAGKKVGELTLHELNAMRNVLGGYAAAIINADEMFMNGKRQSLQETGEGLLMDAYSRKAHSKQGPVMQALSRSLGSGLLKPYTVFSKFKGTKMEAVWQNLRNAEGKHIRNVQEAAGYLENALETYDHQEAINLDGQKERKKNGVKLELASGEEVIFTREELLTITAIWTREKMVGTNHLLKGGITLRDADKGTKMEAYHLTEQDLKNMESTLTDKEKAYRGHMVKYLSTTCSEWGNEVTRQMYGVEKFVESYYIPFQVDQNVLANDPAQAQDARLKVGSFTKGLIKKASNTLQIIPFTELWCSHVEKMSDYNAFVLPIEDMTRLMNYKSETGTVKVAMNRGYGKETTQYILSFLKNLNGNARTADADRWYKRLSGAAKGAAVTFNLSVAFQQAGAGVRAASVLDSKYIAKGMARGLNVNKSYAELEQYAPIAVLKGWGYFDTQQARGLYDRARDNWQGKLNDIAGAGAEFGDKLNWAQMWEAVKAEQEDLLRGETEETILKAAGERFQDVIDQTQVVDSVFQRARWAYEPSHIKDAFLNFMSEPITQYNMMYRAIYDITEAKNNPRKAKDMKQATAQLARTISAMVASGALTAALKTIWTAMRDRDDEKKEEQEDGTTRIVGRRTYWDKYRESYWGNFIDSWEGMVPIFSTMIQPLIEAVSGESSYSSSDELGVQAVTYMGKSLKQFLKVIRGEDDDMGTALYYASMAISYGTGVGFNALFRDLNSMAQTALGAADSELVFMNDGYLLGVREMSTTAWDESKDFNLRLQTAKQYYVYNKAEAAGRGVDTRNKKQSSDLYTTLAVYAYYTYGIDSEEFKAASQAAIDMGATADGFTTAVKNRIKKTEPAVVEAAEALAAGDIPLYQQKISEIMATGVGSKPAEAMVKAMYNSMNTKDKTEEEIGVGGDVRANLKEGISKASETAANEAVLDSLSAAAAEGNAENFGAVVKNMQLLGYTEAQIKTKVTTKLKNRYREACWSGDTETATKLGKMATVEGTGLTNDNLYDWANDTGELYEAVDGNNVERAAKIFKYLINNSKDATKTRKNLDTQLKKRYLAATGESKTNMKALLLKLGYAESTINGWK